MSTQRPDPVATSAGQRLAIQRPADQLTPDRLKSDRLTPDRLAPDRLDAEGLDRDRLDLNGAHLALGLVMGLLLAVWIRAAADAVGARVHPMDGDIPAIEQLVDEQVAHEAMGQAASNRIDAALVHDDLGIAWLPGSVTRWSDVIHAAADRHELDPALLAIVLLVESGGDPAANSPAGAAGLMQVMPGTAGDIVAQRGLGSVDWREPTVNVDLGAWYLADQARRFAGGTRLEDASDIGLAVAAYNAGPGRVQAHLTGAPLPNETERYRSYVTGMWHERDALESPTFARWLEAGGWRLLASAVRGDPGPVAAVP